MVYFWYFFRKNYFAINNGYNIFFVVTPIGLLMRLFGKDILNLKYNKNNTYWIEKKGPKSLMKNQF